MNMLEAEGQLTDQRYQQLLQDRGILVGAGRGRTGVGVGVPPNLGQSELENPPLWSFRRM